MFILYKVLAYVISDIAYSKYARTDLDITLKHML